MMYIMSPKKQEILANAHKTRESL